MFPNTQEPNCEKKGELQGKGKFRHPLRPVASGLKEVNKSSAGTEIWTRKMMPCHFDVAQRYGLGENIRAAQRRSWGLGLRDDILSMSQPRYRTMEHYHLEWVNQLFLWPFSICEFTRG